MIDLKVLNKVIDKIPNPGDIVQKIEDNKIIYESARELSNNSNTKLSNGDRVKNIL